MKLSIWTHWDGKTWEGEIPDKPATSTEPVEPFETLEYIFRFFNRVEDDDHERMAGVGYELPSLSVDDVVTVDGEHWRVSNMGFHRVKLPYPVRHTDEPCVVCGQEIQPGQMYLTVDGPRHFGCRL